MCGMKINCIIFVYIYVLYIYLFNVYLFYIYSCFMGTRAKFNNFVIILAFVWHICLGKFEIVQNILKY